MTIVLKVDQTNPDADVIKRAADTIRRDGTVVFPTETVYGLGANALSERACMRIYRAKKRPMDNPLIVHVATIEQLMECTSEQDPEVMEALEKLWPGPITVLMKKSDRIPYSVTAGLDTVAVRMPANPVALRLIEASGVPIAAPSANIATRPSIVDSSDAVTELDGAVDLILDAGITFFGIESTIINTMKKPVELMRPGAFDQDDLEPYFGTVEISDVARGISCSDVALTPGMKYRHYAPRKAVYVAKDVDKLMEGWTEEIDSRCALIMSSERLGKYGTDGISLGSEKNIYEIARNLFISFREIEKSGKDIGIIQSFPETGVGLAIMNRIRKASSGTLLSADDILPLIQNL